VRNSATLEKEVKKPTVFLNYIHNFRGFAILAIVAHHVIANLQWSHGKQEAVAQILIGNGSVYFVFIAGFLFQFLSTKYKYKDYLKKKINYVIIPYLITSIPAIAMIIAGKYPSPAWFIESFSKLPIPGQVIMYLLTGAHLSVLWFIPMITLFYIISPALIWLDRHPKAYWVLPALLIITILIPRPDFNQNPFQSFIHFLSVYVAGMFCSHFRENLFSFMNRRWSVLICAFITLTALQLWVEAVPNSINTVSKLSLCVVIIYFLWLVEPRTPKVFNIVMGRLAELSFGIYFLHEYFIGYDSSLERVMGIPYSLSQANLVNFLINFFFVLGGSITTILLVKRIFGRKSRSLIGC